MKISNWCTIGAMLVGIYSVYIPGFWPKATFFVLFGIIFVAIAVKGDTYGE